MMFLGMEWALEEDLLYRPKGESASWSGLWMCMNSHTATRRPWWSTTVSS